ncbi:MAG: ABC transporter ATP-binding protein [Acutalibacteraceae bacterium]|nr:ABC transporter ATP-binding protein [Acutalibacteraceae bacterium]
MEKTVILQLKNITKKFGSKVIANNNISLDVYKGEILSVLGENGCGKTTLMNMVAGIYYPDSGKILINGEEVIIRSPRDAFNHKIGMIHQHFKLIDIFSAAQNVALGVEGEKFNLKQVNSRINEMAKKYGFNINLDKKIYEMSVSEKQTVEILKVLYRGADILILDEPTAVLTPQEIKSLFKVLRAMRDDGKSIIIITHKLNEVMEISDRVTVLRKGDHIATVNTSQTSEKELTEMMVGEKVDLNINRTEPVDRKLRLSVSDLTVKSPDGYNVVDNVSFEAFGGEILGIAGIAGSGQKELLEAIAGLNNYENGTLIYYHPKKEKPVSFFHKTYKRVLELAKENAFMDENGNDIDFTKLSKKEIKELVDSEKIIFKEDEVIDLKDKSPREIRELGIRLSFVPEDRLGMGLVGNMDIVDNMMLRSYRKGKSIFLDRKRPQDLADRIISDLKVNTPDSHTAVRKLSGGNVQKVLVGREIAAAPAILMTAYPVRGLDINSSYTIYNLLNEQKQNGVSVIFVGEDLDVLMALSDRILVLSGGKISGIVDARTTTKDEIGLLMVQSDNNEVAK